jgi:predicted MPP superfamily phosphohydrolase
MTKIKRRDFLKLAFLTIAGSSAVAGSYLYAHNETSQLVIEPVQIPIKNLKPALEGFTIAQLSDIHFGGLTKPEIARQAVALANSLNPDLVVLTGDYVWHNVEAIFDLAPILTDLDARYGVYAALGNHEIWTDVGVVLQAFEEIRMPLLVNQGVTIQVGNENLYLAGLDDGWSGRPDLNAALKSAPKNVPVILLFHEPDLADRVSLDSRPSLQLAGHSHGGQVRFPIIGAPVLPYLSWKYNMGLYRVRDMWLYTNRGIGVTNIPVRYNCPPEITLLTLVQASD